VESVKKISIGIWNVTRWEDDVINNLKKSNNDASENGILIMKTAL
jgi:hypothetical protein